MIRVWIAERESVLMPGGPGGDTGSDFQILCPNCNKAKFKHEASLIAEQPHSSGVAA
jgi:5-methylcytosine-specific restriction endonuclease McrA